VDVDLMNERLIGKETGREIKVGDLIRARIVTYKINERNPHESRIGLTMRQPGLGKLEWLEEARKELEEAKKGTKKEGEVKKSKRKGKKK
jgi:DNA-directed RNA polymerase subunit E'